MNHQEQRPLAATDPGNEILDLAKILSLTTLRDRLMDIIAQAETKGLSYSDFALELLRCEVQARRDRRLNLNLKHSGLPAHVEGMDSYDFSIRPHLEARVVREQLNCRWVQEARNIICVGKPGTGKTRFLDSVGKAACTLGFTVLKTTTAQLLESIHAAQADSTTNRVFRRFEKPDVLILDEFGYAPIDSESTSCLFRLVSARHQRRSIVLAANTGFADWKHFFPSEAQAVATVDRLIDRASIFRFTGKSFRKPKEIIGPELED
jgi:DNA replication protein DnaC